MTEAMHDDTKSKAIQWVKLKGTNITGMIVQRLIYSWGYIYALDMNDEGDIFYVNAEDTELCS